MTAETLEPSMTLPTDTDVAQSSLSLTNSAPDEATSFADLGAHPRAVEILAGMGIDTPTLIQARAIPPLLAGRDVIGQSRTGSGKTIAYGLPLVERMDPRLRRMQALVLVPTRELAGQVASVLLSIGASRGLRVAQLIGGRSYLPQREALRMGAQIAVGAPGRVLDHLRQGTLDLSHLTFAVLDEADQMLDAGFAPDVERLLSAMPEHRQLALFTATLPEMTTQIAKRFLHEPVSVDAGTPESRPASTITQIAYTMPREHRLGALMTLLDRRRAASGTTLVFGRTKHGVDKLARQLIARGYPVAALHGNMSQNARDRVLTDFRSGRSPMLVATNVAARGLDVLSIEQVINYELPESAELFTHRVGRTGRMDNAGEAITLLTPDDMAQWRRFQRDLAMKVRPLPFPVEEIGTIPANTAALTPAMAPEASAEVALVAAATEQAEQAEPERQSDWSERRFERRPASRSFGRGGDRRSEGRPTRRFEDRGFAGQRGHEGRYERRQETRYEDRFERGQDRQFGESDRQPAPRQRYDEPRPGRNTDIVARWSRPAPESDRHDDYRSEYRESRYEGRSERAETDRRDNRRDSRRDDHRDERRDTRPGDDRFGGERAPRRDTRRSDRSDRGPARPTGRSTGPRRTPGGFRPAEGAGRGRSPRAHGGRPTRG
ncbi:MAG TPA: DEAD/DEAH box helicase [Ktedonobacterales bacterium]|nr:DEAD/DEAH box helicase [Ktedonobacterales bacterium]